MALSFSVDQTDETGRELLTYGTPDFPIAFFDDNLALIPVAYHWHDELELAIITHGTVRARIAGSEFTLSAGDGYFVNSGILHTEKLESETGWQHAMVFNPRFLCGERDLIQSRYVQPVLNHPRLPFLRLLGSVPWQAEILKLAENAWQQGAHEITDYPIEVRHALTLIFSRILSHADLPDVDAASFDQYRRDELRVKQALLFMEQNADSLISIGDIAKSADISVSTCLRLFRAVLNTTPNRYLVQYRLRRAAEELRRGGRTVSEIAYTCGFSDASYMTRCFRKEYGMTPTEYILLQKNQT